MSEKARIHLSGVMTGAGSAWFATGLMNASLVFLGAGVAVWAASWLVWNGKFDA